MALRHLVGPVATDRAAAAVTSAVPPGGAIQGRSRDRSETGRYDRGVVRGSRLRVIAVPAAIVAGSQLGHALVYYARFGMDASSRQSHGIHSYFPTLAGVASAGIGVLLMASLLVLAAARSRGPRHAGYRRRATLRFSDLLPALFVAQLALFGCQETIESLIVGAHLPSAIELLIWGTLGQLPAAAIASGVVAWLLSRLEAAWTSLLDWAACLLSEPFPPAIVGSPSPGPAAILRLASTYPSAFRKRGPPLCSNP
jgi:hypothetical protein